MSQTRSEMLALLARHGLRPNKQLGQHFLADRNLVGKIVDLAGDPQDRTALEVGAGTGTLTRALAERGFAVRAYEVDAGLEPLLREVLTGTDVDLRIGDASAIEPLELEGREWVLVANLPYHVGTPILLDLLRHAAPVRAAVVMVQREVAERLVAGPGSKDYGLPSVVANLYAEARLAFRVPPQVFVPPPNVESAVVRLERTAEPSPLLDRAVELAGQAFNQRRKMLRSSLRGRLDDAVAVLEAAGLDPTSRAEDVAASGYLALAEEVGP